MSVDAPAVEAIDVDADELVRGRASLEGEGPREAGGNGGGGGGHLPPAPPPPVDGHRRRPERPPRWQLLLLWGAVMVVAFLTGLVLGQLGRIVERGLAAREG